MKPFFIFLLFAISLFSCSQDKQPLIGETEFQREMNAEFKDATKSPLTKKDLKHFKGLDFFTVDSSYVIVANFKKTPDEKPFKMKTTTDRLPEYVKYGEATLILKGETYTLNIYQNKDLILKEGYEDYLFLPFLDHTNGDGSYGGGRYIDTRLPEGETIIIDFNKAYNPYCAYSERYSCPIVPRVNYLKTKIEAGVMAFGAH